MEIRNYEERFYTETVSEFLRRKIEKKHYSLPKSPINITMLGINETFYSGLQPFILEWDTEFLT